MITIVLVAIPRHPHPSTLNTIDAMGKYFEHSFLISGKCVDNSFHFYRLLILICVFLDGDFHHEPGDELYKSDKEVIIYDNMFILRVVLSILLGLVAFFVGGYTLIKHVCEQRYAEPVGRSKLIG